MHFYNWIKIGCVGQHHRKVQTKPNKSEITTRIPKREAFIEKGHFNVRRWRINKRIWLQDGYISDVDNVYKTMAKQINCLEWCAWKVALYSIAFSDLLLLGYTLK